MTHGGGPRSYATPSLPAGASCDRRWQVGERSVPAPARTGAADLATPTFGGVRRDEGYSAAMIASNSARTQRMSEQTNSANCAVRLVSVMAIAPPPLGWDRLSTWRPERLFRATVRLC